MAVWPDDLESWRRQVSAMWLFDYLTANADRHLNNALFAEGPRLFLIDNSRAFKSYDDDPIDNLRAFDKESLKIAIVRYFDDNERRALLHRRGPYPAEERRNWISVGSPVDRQRVDQSQLLICCGRIMLVAVESSEC